jgi:hypothetical protein
MAEQQTWPAWDDESLPWFIDPETGKPTVTFTGAVVEYHTPEEVKGLADRQSRARASLTSAHE